MAPFRRWVLPAALILSSIQPPAVFAANVDAIQLDYVAMDSSLSCGRIFFRSSEHFRNTIFMLPEVVASGGKLYKRTYELTATTDPNVYILNLHLYFPERGDELSSSGASTYDAAPVDCENTDRVKAALNSNVLDPAQRVDTVAAMPLTSIEVAIAGFSNKALIGRTVDNGQSEEADVLSYRGQTLTAVFKVDRNEALYFQQMITDPDGLSATVKMRFQGKARDGAVKAELNIDALSTAFAAAIKGKGQMLAKADVEAALRASLDSRSLMITAEAGKSDAAAKFTQAFVDQILKDMDAAIDVANTKAEAADPDGTNMVSASVALSIIKTKLSRTMEFNQIALPETATAEVPLRIKLTAIRDTNVQDIELKADYVQPSTGMALMAGQTMTIAPSNWKLMRYDYPAKRENTSYLTSSELIQYNLSQAFPILQDTKHLTVTDQPILKIGDSMGVQDSLNKAGIPASGQVMAVGKMKQYYTGITYPGEYRWLRVQYPREEHRVASGHIQADEATIRALPAGLSFALLGGVKVYSFNDLLADTPAWTGRYDAFSGRIFLTAKQDLGLVQFREMMHAPNKKERAAGLKDADADVLYGSPQVMDAVFQEFRGMTGHVTRDKKGVSLRVDETPIIQQRVLDFSITHPVYTDEGAKWANVTTGTTSTDNAKAEPAAEFRQDDGTVTAPVPGSDGPTLTAPNDAKP